MSTRRVIVAALLIAVCTLGDAAALREQRFQFSIQRGSLTSIIQQLSAQTGLHIGKEISAATGSAAAGRYGPFSGTATVDEALKTLLANTDLWYAWRTEDTLRLYGVSMQRLPWSGGVSTAKEASDSIRHLAGRHYDTGGCSELLVGPLNSSEPMTPEEAWIQLISPYCPVRREPSTDIKAGSIDRVTLKGNTTYNFSIPTLPRLAVLRRISEQASIDVTYLSFDAQEEQTLVGPIEGEMSLNDALKGAMHDSVLRVRWMNEKAVSVEPAYTLRPYADMSTCLCDFGFPEWRTPPSEHIVVAGTRLPPLDVSSPGSVTQFDRSLIDETGASTIPELLTYLAGQAFNPSRGYRANGAQYFEGRGFGAQYALILINGRRAYGSAGDPMTNAMDLNAVPLSAVERIEVALDQPSVLYGTDAIGGTVNIVLKQDLGEGAAKTTLGSAQGGSEKQLFTLSADGAWGGTRGGFVLDYLSRGDLLGSQRDRWRNQDFTRYDGGLDYRLPYGAPPNIHAIAGDLPGLQVGSASIGLGPGGAVYRPNDTNMQSALAYAAIVPEHERLSLYGFTNSALPWGELNLGVLLGLQTASLQSFPASAAGLIWGEDHPQNPFHGDVIIDALLTGLPPRTYEAESRLKRVTADWTGAAGSWGYAAFLVAQTDRSTAWITNEIDHESLVASLTTNDPAQALNVLSERPGAFSAPDGLFLTPNKDRYFTKAVEAGIDLSGRLLSWSPGDITAELGMAHRTESVRFDDSMGRVNGDRDITSVYSRLRVPIVSPASTSLLRNLELTMGVRRDYHSDVRDVTTMQGGLAWQPLPAIKLHAGYSELFRPPSLYELYLPRFELPFQVYDPKREEVAAVTLVTGGNALLHSTEGQSLEFGVSLGAEQGWTTSLKYWETRMRDRIGLVLLQDLVNTQPEHLADRIVRNDPTEADDAANRPGRLVQLNTTRANFGAVEARGVDMSVQRPIETSIGRITPRIDITHTLRFRYRDLPAAAAPMQERAGVASPYGTVPSVRAVASLTLDLQRWRASAFARHHSTYRDYSIVAGAPTQDPIRRQTLLDINVTKQIDKHLSVSLGAFNLLDDQPPFAQLGGWEGHDPSQGDLVAREVYLTLSSSF